jgi:hypothetical protein
MVPVAFIELHSNTTQYDFLDKNYAGRSLLDSTDIKSYIWANRASTRSQQY